MKKWLDRYDKGGQAPARDNTAVYRNVLPISMPQLKPAYINPTSNYKDSEWYKQESEDFKTRRNITQPVLHAADVATDIMQFGNFIPLPQAQAIARTGNILGSLVDAYQAADAIANKDYTSGAMNATAALLPLYMRRNEFARDMYNTKPGSLADKIASYGNRDGSYLPLSGVRTNLIKNPVMRKAVDNNKKTFGALLTETGYDSYAEGGESNGWLDKYTGGGLVKKLNPSEIADIKKFANNISRNPQNYLADKNTKGKRKVINTTSPGINTVNTPGVNYNTLQNAAVDNTFNQQQDAFNTFWHSPEGQAYQYNLAIQNDELQKKEERKEAIKNGATFREVPQFGFNNQVIPSDPQMGIPIPDAGATGLADPLNWPLYIATGRAIASGLGAAGEAFLPHLTKVAPYFEAPLTFGETVVPGITPGSVTAAYFANEGIKKLPQTQASIINAYRNPTVSNITNAATDAGWNTMDFLGTGEAIKGATQLAEPIINKAGKAVVNQLSRLPFNNVPLLNQASRFNPWVFETNPNNYYRQIIPETGDVNTYNLLREEALKKNGRILAPRQLNMTNEELTNQFINFSPREQQRMVFPNGAELPLGQIKPSEYPFFQKGKLYYGNQPNGLLVESKSNMADNFMPARINHIALENIPEAQQWSDGIHVFTGTGPNYSSSNFNIYEPNWLMGYKPVEVPESISSFNKLKQYKELFDYKMSVAKGRLSEFLSDTKSKFADVYNSKKLNNEYESARIKLGNGYKDNEGLAEEYSKLGNQVRQEEWEINFKLKNAQEKLGNTKLNEIERKNLLDKIKNLDHQLEAIKYVKQEYKIGDNNTLIKSEANPLLEATNYGDDNILDFNTLKNVPVYVKPSGNRKIIKKVGKDINIESLDYSSPQVSENLPIVHKSNIEFVERAAPGSKVFGSSRGVAEAELTHLSNDYDALITRDNYDKFVKDKYPFLKENGPAQTHDILHGKGVQNGNNQGAVDFVVVEKNAQGKATGKRAQELYRQFDPEGYQKSVKEFMEKYKNKERHDISSEDFENALNIPYTPDELISKVNPEIKTILDSYEINVGNPSKVKHTNRIDAYINYGNPDIVIEAQNKFIKSLVGNKGNIGHQFHISSFDNLEKNLEILDKINFAGDARAVASNPKRMQAALNDYYIHQTTLSRGVNSDHATTGKKLTLEEIEKAFKEWDPDAGGGQAYGAGMNHVSLGKSGDYEYYGHKQIGLNNLDTSDPLKYVEGIKHKTSGNLAFTDEEKALLKDIFVKHGLNHMINNYPINNTNELIRALSHKNDVNKNILNEFSKVTGKKIAITNPYGESLYASTLQDFDDAMDALSYSFSQHTVQPKSKFQRDVNMQNKFTRINPAKTLAEFHEHMNAAKAELKSVRAKQEELNDMRKKLISNNEEILNKTTKYVYDKKYPGRKEQYNNLEKEFYALNKKITELNSRLVRAHYLKQDLKNIGLITGISGLGGGGLFYALNKEKEKQKERHKKYLQDLKKQENGGDTTDYNFAAWQLADPIRASYHVVNPENFHGPDQYKDGGQIHNWREVKVPHKKNQLSGWLDKL